MTSRQTPWRFTCVLLCTALMLSSCSPAAVERPNEEGIQRPNTEVADLQSTGEVRNVYPVEHYVLAMGGGAETETVYGWPLRYLRRHFREPRVRDLSGSNNNPSLWPFFGAPAKSREFRPYPLVLNIFFGVAVVGAAFVGTRHFFTRRNRPPQVSIAGILAFTAAVAIACKYLIRPPVVLNDVRQSWQYPTLMWHFENLLYVPIAYGLVCLIGVLARLVYHVAWRRG